MADVSAPTTKQRAAASPSAHLEGRKTERAVMYPPPSPVGEAARTPHALSSTTEATLDNDLRLIPLLLKKRSLSFSSRNACLLAAVGNPRLYSGYLHLKWGGIELPTFWLEDDRSDP
ncbi:unnamed protein product [Pleuronectes platessa]|uniref:Uncharacterized protein n=1 Tax=Pleuronectes platessa TaxID=8262 RepID=A0A9N7YH07_PLEPL|nr:unnamed protein product [Pleuronectes platessa]